MAERLLLSLGVLAGMVLVSVQARVHAAQQAAERIGSDRLGRLDGPEIAGPAGSGAGAAHGSRGAGTAVIGRLEIPALTVSVPILSDIDATSLRQGAGKVRGTANPGGLGNLVLAGHRDTFFRPLRRIHAGVEIRVADRGGMYRYLVDATEVVNPDQVTVLAIGDRPELTLITCFPFDYVGAAPQRFIVHAHLESALPMAR